MPGRIYLEPTEFTEVRNKQTYLGYTISDDWTYTFNGFWKDIPATNMGVLDRVLEEVKVGRNPDVVDMFAELLIAKEGLYIGGEFYPWDEIKDKVENALKTND
jgi:hypothetical protein